MIWGDPPRVLVMLVTSQSSGSCNEWFHMISWWLEIETVSSGNLWQHDMCGLLRLYSTLGSKKTCFSMRNSLKNALEITWILKPRMLPKCQSNIKQIVPNRSELIHQRGTCFAHGRLAVSNSTTAQPKDQMSAFGKMWVFSWWPLFPQ